ncbi:MAG: tetratricopeptide repeat protein [Gammaproteobacteria bacterium]
MARSTLSRILIGVAALLLLEGCALSSPHLLGVSRQAHAAYQSGKIALALKDYRILAEAHANDPYIWTRIGNLEAIQDQPKKAVTAYRRAIRINPQDGEAWYNMGMVKLREAWAMFIEAYNAIPVGNPAHAHIQTMIQALGRLPALHMTMPHPLSKPDAAHNVMSKDGLRRSGS